MEFAFPGYSECDATRAQVPKYMAEHEVKRGRLVEALQQYRPTPPPISLVYPSHRHVPLRVRALAEALVGRTGACLTAST